MTGVELYLSSNALTALDLRLFQNDFVNELLDTYNPAASAEGDGQWDLMNVS
jgi:hypothetical protein